MAVRGTDKNELASRVDLLEAQAVVATGPQK
jgi:hypothetical protein